MVMLKENKGKFIKKKKGKQIRTCRGSVGGDLKFRSYRPSSKEQGAIKEISYTGRPMKKLQGRHITAVQAQQTSSQ